MARILTIFGPNESSRRDLFFEIFSNGRNKRKYFKKILESFSKKNRLIIFLIQGDSIIARLGYEGDVIWVGSAADLRK